MTILPKLGCNVATDCFSVFHITFCDFFSMTILHCVYVWISTNTGFHKGRTKQDWLWRHNTLLFLTPVLTSVKTKFYVLINNFYFYFFKRRDLESRIKNSFSTFDWWGKIKLQGMILWFQYYWLLMIIVQRFLFFFVYPYRLLHYRLVLSLGGNSDQKPSSCMVWYINFRVRRRIMTIKKHGY